MPNRTAAPPAVIAPPAPTVPAVAAAALQPAPIVTRAAEPAFEAKLAEATRALLRAIPRDIAGLPGITPEKYAEYLAARDAVERELAGR